MNPERQRQILAKKEFSKPRTPFREIDLMTAPAGSIPRGMTRAFRDNRYTVMIYDDTPTTHGPATKVLIQKHDNSVFPDHWKELQRIKNEIFGRNVYAIEYFPAEGDKIDDFNIYWLWIFPDDVLPKMIQ